LGSNNFTKNYSDGSAFTEAQLTTACQSLTPDISNTTQMTSGSTSGNFLKSNGDGVAASWGLPLDPLGPFAIRNYGLSTSISTGALTIALKANSGGNPSASDIVDIPFSNNGSTTATYTALQVTAALSFTITASATLGFTGTSTNRVFVYAINNAGTVKLAASARSDLDIGATTTTVQMTSAADSGTALYATAALTVVPRLLGFVDAAISSAGNWQTPSHCGVLNTSGSADQIAQGITSIGANKVINAYTRTVVNGTSTAAVRSVALSASCGSFVVGSTALTSVTNLTISITTSGRPIKLELVNDASGNDGDVGINSGTINMNLRFLRNGSAFNTQVLNLTGSGANLIPCSSYQCIDTQAAGTYTYSVAIQANSANARVQYAKLLAYEL
jgi:hypothetical protein